MPPQTTVSSSRSQYIDLGWTFLVIGSVNLYSCQKLGLALPSSTRSRTNCLAVDILEVDQVLADHLLVCAVGAHHTIQTIYDEVQIAVGERTILFRDFGIAFFIAVRLDVRNAFLHHRLRLVSRGEFALLGGKGCRRQSYRNYRNCYLPFEFHDSLSLLLVKNQNYFFVSPGQPHWLHTWIESLPAAGATLVGPYAAALV